MSHMFLLGVDISKSAALICLLKRFSGDLKNISHCDQVFQRKARVLKMNSSVSHHFFPRSTHLSYAIHIYFIALYSYCVNNCLICSSVNLS